MPVFRVTLHQVALQAAMRRVQIFLRVARNTIFVVSWGEGVWADCWGKWHSTNWNSRALSVWCGKRTEENFGAMANGYMNPLRKGKHRRHEFSGNAFFRKSWRFRIPLFKKRKKGLLLGNAFEVHVVPFSMQPTTPFLGNNIFARSQEFFFSLWTRERELASHRAAQ